MTAMQLQLNSDLFGALQVISGDEGLMKKAVKSLKRLASEVTGNSVLLHYMPHMRTPGNLRNGIPFFCCTQSPRLILLLICILPVWVE